jgi:kynurenine 3-monooxygenase
MMIALPNRNCTFTCTIFLPHNGELSFSALHTPEHVERFVANNFPDVISQMPVFLKDFAANPVGHMVTVKTDRWHFESDVLLLGDAAHAIIPFFGQGMNCGFEDCVYFNQVLEETGDDWTKALPLTVSSRKPNADAIADMAVENFVEMADKVNDPHFILTKEVENLISKAFPGKYLSRYQLVSFSTVPYTFAQKIGRVQKEMLDKLCAEIKRPEQVDLEEVGQWIRSVLGPMLKPFLNCP